MESKIFFRNRIFSSTFYFLILPLSLSRCNSFSPSRHKYSNVYGQGCKERNHGCMANGVINTNSTERLISANRSYTVYIPIYLFL